mmetsp:Transcript_389/g.568  ORF Transcript_389/g.568 Transcript_389/m.568 type:complete len:86 (-) Transcript_389:171-428(-)
MSVLCLLELSICFVFADSFCHLFLSSFQSIVDKKKVSLPGFGTFQLKQRAARKGRNPQTGEELDIAASLAPSFSAAKGLKERANE